jgi:hypothetical protein
VDTLTWLNSAACVETKSQSSLVSLILIIYLFSSMLNCLLGRCVSVYCLSLALPRSRSLSLSLSLLRGKSLFLSLSLFPLFVSLLSLLPYASHCQPLFLSLVVSVSLRTPFLVSTAFSSTIVVVPTGAASHVLEILHLDVPGVIAVQRRVVWYECTVTRSPD